MDRVTVDRGEFSMLAAEAMEAINDAVEKTWWETKFRMKGNKVVIELTFTAAVGRMVECPEILEFDDIEGQQMLF